MTSYTARVTRVTLSLEGMPIFDEYTTHVEIDDDGAGEFVVIRQCCDQAESGAVAIDKNQWPHIRDAVDKLMEVVRDE